MPSIELVSLGAIDTGNVPTFKTFNFVSEVGVPEGHRGSFNKSLGRLQGLTVHLGNNDLDRNEDMYWHADKLVDWDSVDSQSPIGSESTAFCIFKREVVPDLTKLIDELILRSPERKLVFMTDYQFVENEPQEKPFLSKEEFIEMLASGKIRFNTLYQVLDSVAEKDPQMLSVSTDDTPL